MDNNGENDWYHSQGSFSSNNPDLKDLDSGSYSLQFGDTEENKNEQDFARSAYINKKFLALF